MHRPTFLAAWGCALLACLLTAAFESGTRAEPWQPSAGNRQILLWPDSLAIAPPAIPGDETVRTGSGMIAGRPVTMVEHVSRPAMTIYPARGLNSGAAIIVFPGGGYQVLAIDLEGTEICDWLTAKGITCVLLKYRVPGSGPWWDSRCNCRRIPEVPMALQDAQRAMVMLRRRAADLGVDPHRIGVLGFSAGGHLVAAISNAPARSYAPMDEADALSSRPDFAVALYPGHLWTGEGLGLAPDIHVSETTPPTFLIQAEDDPVDDVRHSLAYYMALREAHVPVEMHLFAHGGHAFGLRHTDQPITDWPVLVERWLHDIGILRASLPDRP